MLIVNSKKSTQKYVMLAETTMTWREIVNAREITHKRFLPSTNFPLVFFNLLPSFKVSSC
jgi:hypothetical protein